MEWMPATMDPPRRVPGRGGAGRCPIRVRERLRRWKRRLGSPPYGGGGVARGRWRGARPPRVATAVGAGGVWVVANSGPRVIEFASMDGRRVGKPIPVAA